MLKLHKVWLKINPRRYARTDKNHYLLKWRSPNLVLRSIVLDKSSHYAFYSRIQVFEPHLS
ncbi:hypothetical protein [Nostoc sp.]|uniref:hypothetical protein n=1 Tax=Nostoc sp. TaxID=1180 RepID=UPI002FFA3F25